MSRILKRILLWLPLPLLLAGCGYDQIQQIDISDLHPTMVAPVIRERMTIEDFIERKEDSTKVEYDEDGTAFVVYSSTQDLNLPRFKTNSTVYGAHQHTTPITLSTTSDETVSVQPQLIFVVGALLDEVVMDYTSAKVCIKLSERATIDGSLQFPNLPGAPTRVLKNQEAVDSIVYDLGDLMRNVVVKLNRNDFPINLTKLKLAEGSSKSVTVTISVLLEGVQVSRAKGVPVSGGGAANTSLNNEIDLFKTSIAAKQSLPWAKVLVSVKKPKSFEVDFTVDKVLAVYNPESEHAGNANIENKAGVTLTSKDLQIGSTKNNIAAQDLDSATFILDDKNSNVATELFGKAAGKLKLENLNITSLYRGGGDLPLNSKHNGSFNVDVKIPFYGYAISSEMKSILQVSGNAFPSAEKFLHEAEEQGAKTSVILFRMRFTSHMPMDMYSRFTFLDEAKNPIFELPLKNIDNVSKQRNGKEYALCIVSGKINSQGDVEAEVITESQAELTIDEYKLISEKAKFLQINYYMETPDMESKKNVRVTKDDYVLLDIGCKAVCSISR